VDPLQLHKGTGVKCASRQRTSRLAWLAICAAYLLGGAISPAQEAAENAPASTVVTVHGLVSNAVTGEPLSRALVRIEGDADTGTLTDGEGRFEIPNVPAGPQTIRVTKPGFHDRTYATEDVDYQSDGPAHSVLLAADMPDLKFTLSPPATIRGQVELSTGDPAQGFAVTLLKQVVHNGRAVWAQNGVTKTNGDGAYRFAGLPGGVYALFTQPTLESEPAVTAVAAGANVVREGYASVFYPEAREFSAAARIRLATGEQAEANLRLHLEPFYTVTAKTVLPNGKLLAADEARGSLSPASLGMVFVLDAAKHPTAYTGQFDSATHTIQASLPGGAYTLLAVTRSDESNAQHPENLPGRATRKPAYLWGFAEISVDGHATANLPISLSPMTRWPIHVRAVRTSSQASANQEPQKLVSVTATHAYEEPMDSGSDNHTAEDAGLELLEISGLSSYWISTQLNERNLCVDSFTSGGINLAREPLNLGFGASVPPMELTLRDDCAKLTLTLPPTLAAFVPGDEPFYTVYVVPDFDTTTDIPPMNVHPSSGATVTVDGLTPGGYHVYTFDRPVRLEYRNPAVLAALPTPGQAVTLTAGTTSSLVLEVSGR